MSQITLCWECQSFKMSQHLSEYLRLALIETQFHRLYEKDGNSHSATHLCAHRQAEPRICIHHSIRTFAIDSIFLFLSAYYFWTFSGFIRQTQ